MLYVRNLPFNITSEEMYDIFGKYGAIRQIRIGTSKDTRGTAFVVYEDIYDAKTAVDHLSGFNVANRYLIVLYYQPAKMNKKFNQKKKERDRKEGEGGGGGRRRVGVCGEGSISGVGRARAERERERGERGDKNWGRSFFN